MMAKNGISRTTAQANPTVALLTQVLKPALRAYAFGHISTTGPKVAGLLIALIARKKNLQRQIDKLKYISTASLGLYRFPAFSGLLVGLYTLLTHLLLRLPSPLTSSPPTASRLRLIRLVSALIASWTTFPMLNLGDARATRRTRAASDVQVDPTMAHLEADPTFTRARDHLSATYAPGGKPPPPLAGRTIDLTIMAGVRALETLAWHGWRRRHRSGGGGGTAAGTVAAGLLAGASDSAVFIGSCAVIMWSWFYSPLSLPPSYRRWIGQAAGVEPGLVEVLRKARWGQFVYGKDTGQAFIMEGMCRKHGWPVEWADPSVTVPVPCEVVHGGSGRSCHWHKVVKFWEVWTFAMRMYLPLQLLLRLRGGRVTAEVLRRCVLEASRSSAFLGAFVTLFYYGVCLARTLVGPRVFSLDTVTRQMWDSGLCVGAGSLLCGWSVLLEPARRRQELALFVLPRAASCFVPGKYDREFLNRERAAFASGVAVLFAMAHESPANVRGILGSLIHTVIA